MFTTIIMGVFAVIVGAIALFLCVIVAGILAEYTAESFAIAVLIVIAYFLGTTILNGIGG